MRDGQSGHSGEDSALISCQCKSLALGLERPSQGGRDEQAHPMLSSITFMSWRPLQLPCCRERICTSLQGS